MKLSLNKEIFTLIFLVISLVLFANDLDKSASIRSIQPIEEIQKKHASSIGVKILGGVFFNDDNSHNVILLKEVTSNKVNAYRDGFLILEKYEIISILLKQFKVKFSDENKTLTKYWLVEDGFEDILNTNRSDTKLSSDAGLASKLFYKEDGFERDFSEGKGNINLTAEYKKKILTNLPNILMEARAEAVIKNGEFVGIGMYDIDEGYLTRSGVRSGDVVVEIDGQRIDNVASALRLAQAMKSSSTVNIVMLRDGSEFPITISVSE